MTVTIIGASKLLRWLPVATTVMVSSAALAFLAGAALEEDVVLVFCAKATVGRAQAIARLKAEKRSRVENVRGMVQLSVCNKTYQ